MEKCYKIQSATYCEDYKLRIVFEDGHVNIFDYYSLVSTDHQEFSPYLDVKKFKKFKIVDQGRGIAWGNNWDMILPARILRKRKWVKFGMSKKFLLDFYLKNFKR